MGEKGDLGAKLGISDTFAYDIISQIGNYKEIFEGDNHITKEKNISEEKTNFSD